LLLDLHHRQQTILVIVTHSAALAEKLPIRFELVDRRLRRRDIFEMQPRSDGGSGRSGGSGGKDARF